MSAVFHIKRPSSMLGDPEKSGAQQFFELNIKYLKVIGKYPATGLAKSIDIELQAGRNPGYLLRFPISGVSCPDVLVVVRDKNTKQIIGSSTISTSFGFFIDDCKGTGTINIDSSWTPSGSSDVLIEVYENGSVSQITPEIIPIYVSQPFNLGIDANQAKKEGLLREESVSPLAAGFNQLAGPSKQLAKYAVWGGLGYLAFKNREMINREFQKLLK